jgi:UDP-GlcNAc3NAcA epimerase
MPEEVNRIMCDHVSTLLFSPTKTGLSNLVNEGFNLSSNGNATMDNPQIYHCGDVMYDNSIYFSELSDKQSNLINELGIEENKFILSTVHRNDNTDNVENLQNIFQSFIEIGEMYQLPIILPLHPRTSKMMEKILPIELLTKISESKYIRIIPPASFLDIISLEKNCKLVITDSGGVQKEAYFFKKPCIILRPQTEWVEIVETGSAVITDANKQKIIAAVAEFFSNKELAFPPVFGDGKAAEFIVDEVVKQLK